MANFNAIEALSVCRDRRGTIVIVDNTNLYIEAKKVAAKKLRLESRFPEDPRYRVNYESLLAKIVGSEDTLAHCYVFGSSSAKGTGTNADFHSAIETLPNVTVDVSVRSAWTGREKQVDHKISCLLTAIAALLPGRRVCLISGDGDYASPVNTAMDMGVKMEVYAWSTCMASSLKTLMPRLNAYYLDEIWADVGFMEYDRTGHVSFEAVHKCAIVFTFGLHRDLIMEMIRAMRSPAFYFYEGDAVVLVPSLNRDDDMYRKECFDHARHMHGHRTVVTGLTWATGYASSNEVQSDEDEDEGDWVVAGEENSTRSNEHTTCVAAHAPTHSSACYFREFCMEGEQCQFTHSDAELKLFASGKAPHLLKTRMCTSREKCSLAVCYFNHPGEKAFCRICGTIGCKYDNTTPHPHVQRDVIARGSAQFKSFANRGYMK